MVLLAMHSSVNGLNQRVKLEQVNCILSQNFNTVNSIDNVCVQNKSSLNINTYNGTIFAYVNCRIHQREHWLQLCIATVEVTSKTSTSTVLRLC